MVELRWKWRTRHERRQRSFDAIHDLDSQILRATHTNADRSTPRCRTRKQRDQSACRSATSGNSNPARWSRYKNIAKTPCCSTTNLAPTSLKLDAEEVPKGAARILNAATVQAKYREDMKKRAREADSADQQPNKRQKLDKQLQIQARQFGLIRFHALTSLQPGESVGHFNRRVEDSLRSNIQAARTTARKVDVKPLSKDAKQKKQQREKPESSPERSPSPPPIKEFATATTGRRVRDVVLAPPTFAGDKFTAKAKVKPGSSKADNVVSAAQARMMHLEREKAIAQYRAIKAARAARSDIQQ